MAATLRNIRSAWLRQRRTKLPKTKNWALARKLLNWEVVEVSFWNQDLEAIPYDEPILFLTDNGSVYRDFIYDQTQAEYVTRSRHWGNGRQVVAWAHIPPLVEKQTYPIEPQNTPSDPHGGEG